MSDSNLRKDDVALDFETQKAIGNHLERMYHTVRSVHEMAAQMVGDEDARTESAYWAVQELTRLQCKELDALGSRLQNTSLGYYQAHFGNVDVT